MRSTSSSITSCCSQKTPEKSGVYTVRPSMRTSSLLPTALLKPRALMAYCAGSMRATFRLAASRRASGNVVAPERRMSSWVITWIAEGASASFSGRFETEVTSSSSSSSTLIFFSVPVEGGGGEGAVVSGVCAGAKPADASSCPSTSGNRIPLRRGPVMIRTRLAFHR
jgi:hypothetical protein